MPGVIHPSESLRAVLKNQESMAFCERDERVHVHAAAEKMRDYNGARSWRNRGFHGGNFGSELCQIQIQRNRNQAVFPGDIRHFANREGGHQDFAASRPRLCFQEKIEAGAHGEGNQHRAGWSKRAADLRFRFRRVGWKKTPQHRNGKIAPANVQQLSWIQQQLATRHRRKVAAFYTSTTEGATQH